MCGIVGYIGFRRADSLLVNSLKRLEYRGYDSWGIVIKSPDGLKIHKRVGAIGDVEGFELGKGNIGLGHTRWATHGKPSEENAHPHVDCTGKIAVVHNGIISNFQSLREELERRGHVFKSETDTEVLAHLIEENYSGDLKEALLRGISRIKGSYAVVALHSDRDELVAVRNKSPLILGIGDEEFIIASDVPAMLEYTNRVVYLEDGDVLKLTKDGFEIWNGGVRVARDVNLIQWSIEDAEKGGYEHFMLKEIHEIPRVITDTLDEYIEEEILIDDEIFRDVDEIIFVACGTSYHASLIGKYVIERFSGIPVRVDFASEFIYYPPQKMRRALVIGVTQSGETADTLEAMRIAKKRGARVLTLTNVLGSSATRIADHVLYMRAGPEICVAATKSFIAQLLLIYLIALKLSELTTSEKREIIEEMRRVSEAVRTILDEKERIDEISREIAGYDNVIYIGRGLGYPVALEGALKMKEISYIHAEGYPAGELKHGPFALLGKRVPVIATVVRDETYEIMLNNMKEVRARDSPVIAVADEGDEEVEKYVDFVIEVPETLPVLSAITHSVALQLLAYYTAKMRGCEIDKPRNLAKSVTVE